MQTCFSGKCTGKKIRKSKLLKRSFVLSLEKQKNPGSVDSERTYEGSFTDLLTLPFERLVLLLWENLLN